MIKHAHRRVQNIFRKRYHQKYHQAHLLFLFDISLLTLAIVLVGVSVFFFFRNNTAQEPVRVSIDLGDQALVAGEPITTTITLHNRTLSPITNVSFQIFSPRPWQSVTGKEELPTQTILPQGSVHSHYSGILWGDVGVPYKFYLVTRYEAAGTSYEQITTYLPILSRSILESAFSFLATSSYPGTKIPFTYSLTNQSTRTIDHILLTANGDLELISSSTLHLPTESFSLKPKERYTFDGYVIAPTKDTVFRTGVSTSLEVRPGDIVPLQSAQQSLRVFYPELISLLTLQNPEQTVRNDTTVTLTAYWKNSSQLTLSDTMLTIKTDPSFSQKTIPLGTLAPGVAGSTTLFLPLSSRDTASTSLITIFPLLKTKTPFLNNQTFEIQGQGVSIPYENELTTATEIRYYTPEGDQLGRGPLPPKQGETTRYWLSIAARPRNRPLTHATVLIHLGESVTFTGKQRLSDLGSLHISTSTNEASWSGTLPGDTTSTWYVELALTPTEKDLQTQPIMVETGFVEGVDSFTSTTLRHIFARKTNQLPSDDRGSASDPHVIK